MKKAILVVICLILTGCASSFRNDVTGSIDLKKYNRAYIESHPVDEFGIYRGIFWEMKDIGLSIVSAPFDPPQPGDLNISFTYDAGWDMTRYLKSFQIHLSDALSKNVLAIQSYYSVGMWRGVRDRRLEDAFNEIRKTSNLPPTTQFPDNHVPIEQ